MRPEAGADARPYDIPYLPPDIAGPVQAYRGCGSPPVQAGYGQGVPEHDGKTARGRPARFSYGRSQRGSVRFVYTQQRPVEFPVVKGEMIVGRGENFHTLRRMARGVQARVMVVFAGRDVKAAFPQAGQHPPVAAVDEKQSASLSGPCAEKGPQQSCLLRQDEMSRKADGPQGL